MLNISSTCSLQHPTSAMTGMIPEEEEEESPSLAKKIRKLQNDEVEVCEDAMNACMAPVRSQCISAFCCRMMRLV